MDGWKTIGSFWVSAWECHGCVEIRSHFQNFTYHSWPIFGWGWVGEIWEIGKSFAGHLEQFGIHNISTDFSLERRIFSEMVGSWVMTSNDTIFFGIRNSCWWYAKVKGSQNAAAATVYLSLNQCRDMDMRKNPQNRENFSYRSIYSCRSRPYDSRLEEG